MPPQRFPSMKIADWGSATKYQTNLNSENALNILINLEIFGFLDYDSLDGSFEIKSWAFDFVKSQDGRQGAAYSTFGKALISLDKLGVAPCQARLSRKTPAPAGAPTKVECFIHSGSSAGRGGDCCKV